MSEDEAGVQPGEANGGDGITAGMLLRQAREASGLHIAALAVALKVPVKKLEALEADRLDLLPDAVFVRALASSMCRTLKADPAPILARLPQTGAPRLARQEPGLNAPFRAPSDGPGPSMWDQLSRPAVAGVLALLLAALVLIFMPPLQRGDDVVVAPEPAAVPMAAPQQVPQGTAVESVMPAVSATVAVSAANSTPTVASPTLVITPPAAAAPALAASGAVVAGPASGLVTFRTSGPSWVEVTDAKGVVTLRRTLAAGESAAASGALPLSVVVGRADVTDVQVRGKPFSMAPLVRDNVARFEVK
jgi:cytoskeleton protein RodZ